MIIVDIIGYSIFGFLTVTTGLFALEIFCSFFGSKAPSSASDARPRSTVLIPAHNEACVIAATIKDLIQKFDGQVLVIADNCNDDTAIIARDAGANVIERTDGDNRGKGFALDFGISHLKSDPPDVVMILDADCVTENDSMKRLAQQAYMSKRPVQALNLMDNPEDTSLKQKVAAFAFYVKNYVRPMGLKTLGLPCQLTGTGMAFPWTLISEAKLASANIVEDMKFGIDLVSAGKGAMFYPYATVNSTFPSDEDAIKSQRTRWEHGHLYSIFTEALPMFFKGIVRLNVPTIMFAIDLAILPLSLLTMTLVGFFALSVLTVTSMGDAHYLFWSLTLLCVFIFWSLVAWAVYGRKYLSLSELVAIPFYILAKIPLYFGFFKNREKEWKRTERDA